MGFPVPSDQQSRYLSHSKPEKVTFEKEFKEIWIAIAEVRRLNPNLRQMPQVVNDSFDGFSKGVVTFFGDDESGLEELEAVCYSTNLVHFRMALSTKAVKVQVEFTTFRPFGSGMPQRFTDSGWRRRSDYPPL
jgi:hypothetical protein